MKRPGAIQIFAVILMLAASARAADVEDIYVGPTGNDVNDGTKLQPFATLQRAQKAVREIRAKGHGATVILGGGTYYLPQTLTLTDQDSGATDAPVIWRAAEGEAPIISGGTKLSLTWSPYKDGIYQAKAPEGLRIDELFINGEKQVLARYPNFDSNAQYFNGSSSDAVSQKRAARWADPKGGFIHAMHGNMWGSLHYQITGKDARGNPIYEGGWQNNRPTKMHGTLRYVEAVFEELDAPGEWFHDQKTNTLYFFPPANMDLAKATVETASLTHLIEIKGDAAKPVRFVVFDGLTFKHAARSFMQTREPLLRSDWRIYRGGAVLISGAEDCRLKNCTLEQLGGNAIFVSNYARRISIDDCHIDKIGASGVAFVGDPAAVRNGLSDIDKKNTLADIDKMPGPLTDNYPMDCIVDDCLIHRIGQVEKQASGVEIAMAQGITVRHCSIYDTPRAGINIGDGCWGGDVIEFCDVFDTVKESGDHGSFNSWGRDRWWNLTGFDPNTATTGDNKEVSRLDTVQPIILRNNRFRCDNGWDIDLDDGSTNYEIRNNLCLKGGIKNREGFYRVVENNIMVGNSFHPHVWYKASEDIFRRNIVFGEYKPIGVGKPWGKEVDFNLSHHSGQSEPTTAALALQAQSGRDAHSIVADAMFYDPPHGDFRVKDGSPALKLGFENFAMDQFGVQGKKLKAIALTPEIPGSEPVAVHASHRSSSGYWLGVAIRELQGEEYSTFGVTRDSGGIHLPKVPPGTLAAKAGLRDNDLVQGINDKPVKSIAEMFAAPSANNGMPLSISFVRDQQKHMAQVADYIYFSITQSATPAKLQPRPSGTAAIKFTAQPKPINGPATELGDGKLIPDYGPVFGNGVVNGCYKADLGQPTEIREVNAWSYRLMASRGPQKFVLYATNADKDPGWDVGNSNLFTPIAGVDTTAQPADVWQMTTIRAAGAATLVNGAG